MLIDKQNTPMVAMEFMNDVHMEDIDIINKLFESILRYEENSSCENKELINAQYEAWYEHTLEHFKGEETMMREKNFPPYLFHKGEHDKALSIMDNEFRKWQAANDIQALKHYFTEELPQWLIQHIQSMDTVTAMFFKSGLSPCQIS